MLDPSCTDEPAGTRARISWTLRLYVAGQTPRSVAAFENLRRVCDQHLAGCYELEVVDLLVNPAIAREHQIVAIPTLVRVLPMPVRKLIGDLSDRQQLLAGLEILPG